MRARAVAAGVVSVAVLSLSAAAVPGASASAPGVRYLDPVFTDVQVTRDLVYGRAETAAGQARDLHLDLYEPAGDSEVDRPVFIWAHGGFFTRGDKSEIGAIAPFMSTRGWVTISIEYRLDPYLPEGLEGYLSDVDLPYNLARLGEAIRDAQHDMQAAVRWVRANAPAYGLDPDRIATGGFSAGATTSMAVAYNSDDPGDSGNPGHPSHVRAAIGTGTLNVPFLDIHPDLAVEPPVAMFHGEDDESPYLAPVATCLVAQLLLNVCEARVYAGEGHSSRTGMADWPAFLYRWVIQRTPPPVALPPGTLPLLPSLHVPSTLVPRLG